MKAIVFGITGQDGSHLADLLLAKGYKVVGVARRCSVDNTQRVKHLLGVDGFDLVLGDITDVHSIMSILRENDDVNEVYNLAAQSHVAVSFKQPGLTWDATAKGCMNILQSLVDLGMINARFYQASSSEMFGKNYDEKDTGISLLSNPPKPQTEKYQNEDTKFLPQSPYAIAKCAAHYMTRLFREGYGLHASAGILFNHEGPRRGEDFVTRKITKWIGEFVKWVDGKENIITGDQDSIQSLDPIDRFPKLRLGNLEAFRDWGYAGDYVEAMWMMLQKDSPDDYVICTGKTHTIREFLDVAFKHVGIDDWSEYVVQDPEFYRPAEVDYLRGDNQKAKEALGWEPKHSFQDLVKMMVESDTDDVK
jgi:GDPmannose 4,6-dehydratase